MGIATFIFDATLIISGKWKILDAYTNALRLHLTDTERRRE